MIKLKDILNEEWSDKYKRSIDCDNPKGFSQKAHCQGREKKESVNELMLPRDVDSKMKELGISKIPISSQGEKVLNGMVKEKFLDKVTNKERLIYFVESLGKEKFGYGSKGKLLSPLVDRFWNDITTDGIYFGGKMAAYQVAMNIKDMKRNGEEIDSSYEMMKEYFKNFGMNHSGSRVFDSALRNLGEWMKRNKIEESVNESSVEIGDNVFFPPAKSAATVVDRFGRSVTLKLANGKKVKTVIDKIKLLAQDNVNEVGSGDWHFKAIKKLNEEFIKLFEENVPTNPALWDKAIAAAKRKYDVYPSAYANAFASKWYKEKGGEWKTEESIHEGLVQSIGTVYTKLVPAEIYNAINPQQIEKRKSFVKELVKTLNRFYKQNGVDWKFTEDMFKFKMYSKN